MSLSGLYVVENLEEKKNIFLKFTFEFKVFISFRI